MNKVVAEQIDLSGLADVDRDQLVDYLNIVIEEDSALARQIESLLEEEMINASSLFEIDEFKKGFETHLNASQIADLFDNVEIGGNQTSLLSSFAEDIHDIDVDIPEPEEMHFDEPLKASAKALDPNEVIKNDEDLKSEAISIDSIPASSKTDEEMAIVGDQRKLDSREQEAEAIVDMVMGKLGGQVPSSSAIPNMEATRPIEPQRESLIGSVMNYGGAKLDQLSRALNTKAERTRTSDKFKDIRDVIDGTAIAAKPERADVIDISKIRERMAQYTPATAQERLAQISDSRLKNDLSYVENMMNEIQQSADIKNHKIENADGMTLEEAVDLHTNEKGPMKLMAAGFIASSIKDSGIDLEMESTFVENNLSKLKVGLSDLRRNALSNGWSEEQLEERVVKPVGEWLDENQEGINFIDRLVEFEDEESKKQRMKEISASVHAAVEKLKEMMNKLFPKENSQETTKSITR